MATRAAHKRLTREYASLSRDPPEYITAHPSEQNILEWHYVLTGPPNTPYHGGQYWGTLVFPPDYPFAPPAIRMHTPSGRFKCSERLCLSISDFHPKSYNPAWEVSTILLGVLSFMTSEEKTTGSIQATTPEREWFAKRTRWWNSTGGGSTNKGATREAQGRSKGGNGSIKAGDGGKKFREQWPDLDDENWKWMAEQQVDPQTGESVRLKLWQSPDADGSSSNISNGRLGSAKGSIGKKLALQPEAQRSWLSRNKYYLIGGLLFVYVLVARVLRDQES